MTGKPRLPETIEVLERAGFSFALDYDDTLLWEPPASIDVHALEAIVEGWRDEIAKLVSRRAARQRARCHGGPLDGRPCPWFYRYMPVCTEKGKFLRMLEVFEGLHVARGKWAVYRIEQDGRAFFCGWATNRRDARRGVVKSAA